MEGKFPHSNDFKAALWVLCEHLIVPLRRYSLLLLTCTLTEITYVIVNMVDPWDEVDAKLRVLGFQDQCPEAEDVLYDPVLFLLDFLERPEVDRLVVVDREECFLDTVDAPISRDDDVEEVHVEPQEEVPLYCGEKEEEDDEYSPANFRIFYSKEEEDDVSCREYCNCREEHPYKGSEKSNPVLPEVELEALMDILALEGVIGHQVMRIYHRKRDERMKTKRSPSVWKNITSRSRSKVKKRKNDSSASLGKEIPRALLLNTVQRKSSIEITTRPTMVQARYMGGKAQEYS